MEAQGTSIICENCNKNSVIWISNFQNNNNNNKLLHNTITSKVKVKLTVRYILTDITWERESVPFQWFFFFPELEPQFLKKADHLT